MELLLKKEIHMVNDEELSKIIESWEKFPKAAMMVETDVSNSILSKHTLGMSLAFLCLIFEQVINTFLKVVIRLVS